MGGRGEGHGCAVAAAVVLAACTFSSTVRASDLGPELDAQLATADQGDLDPAKVGFRAAFFLLGRLVGGSGALAWEPERWLEDNLGFAFARATLEETTLDGGTASGDVRARFFFLDMKFWIGREHAAVPQLGLLVSYY